MSTSGIIPSLDGFRAIAIAIVFAGHARLMPGIPGGYGVTIFFFLSGFLITSLLIREYDRYGSISFPAFFARRVLRLLPPLAATLAVGILLVLAGRVPGDLDLQTFASQILFYYNYFYVYGAGESSVEGTSILWSLSVEEHFYLVWPVMFLIIVRGKIGLRLIVTVLVAIPIWRAIRFLVWGDSEWVIYSLTDTRFDGMLYGCLLALMIAQGSAEKLFTQTAPRRAFYLCGAVLLTLATLAFRDPLFRSTLRYSLQGIALMPLFYYAVTRPNLSVFQPLNWGWVRWLGTMSYTFYISHYIIIYVFKGYGLFDRNYGLFFVATVSTALLWSAAVYYILERPLTPLRKRLIGHAAPPVSSHNSIAEKT